MADTFKPAQLQPASLAGSGVSVGATTLTLKSFQSIDGVNLAMTDFGTIAFGTIEPGSSDREEQISFTGITQNASGTATLTGVKTVLFLSPYTASSGVSKSHPGGVTFVISNTSGFYDTFANKGNDETITGTWFVPDPLSNTQIANKEYVDNLVNGGTVSIDTIIVAGTAGTTVSSGNLVYLKSSDGRWYPTSASTASTVNNVELGIAQGAGTAAASITGGVLIRGLDTKNTGLTPGSTYYASNTSGLIATSAGTTSRVVGVGDASGKLLFDPYFAAIPTDAEKAALAGSGTAPTATNTFTTAADVQKGAVNYAADAQSSDTYVVSLSPAIASYTTGLQLTFKANTLNTGAATLNVNGKGAIAIVKNFNVALATGDIVAGQDVQVIYDGTNFQMLSPIGGTSAKTSGTATHAYNASSTQTIAHGLGVVPKIVTFTGINACTASSGTAITGNCISQGSFDGTNALCVYQTSGTTSTNNTGGSNTTHVMFFAVATSDNGMRATCAVDATNITLTWDVSGSAANSTATFNWIAFS